MPIDLPSKLAALGLELPAAPKAVAAYVPAARSGDLIHVSGQLPFADGKLLAVGAVTSAVSLEQAQAAARQCVLSALAIVDDMLGGDWSRFGRVVRLGAFVCSDPDFTDQHLVANGASDLLVQLLGDAGRHARTAVGVTALPLGAAVEIEMAVQVADSP